MVEVVDIMVVEQEEDLQLEYLLVVLVMMEVVEVVLEE